MENERVVLLQKIKGKIVSIIGYAIAIVIGLPLILGAFTDVGSIVTAIVLLGLGILLILTGMKIKRILNRFQNYNNIISFKDRYSLEKIADITSNSIDFVIADLEKMIQMKLFDEAFIDKTTNQIIFSTDDEYYDDEEYYDEVDDEEVYDEDDEDYEDEDEDTENENVKPKIVVVRCSGCGATNRVRKGRSVECDYCGSTIRG